MPKVSVIIPVYNTAQYLEESISSIVNQTLRDIEIIIVDDGSSDGSSDVIEKFANDDKRIIFIKQKNYGQSVARNVAIDIAQGDYIYFMDSDDILNLDALFLCLDRCNKNNLDLLFFDGNIIYEEGAKEISWDYNRSNYFNEYELYCGKFLIENMLATYSFRAVPWLYLVRTDYFRKLNIRFLPNIIHEDELFTFLLFLQSDKIGYLNKKLIFHRIRCNSTMSKVFSLFNVDCYIEVLKEVQKLKKTNLTYSEVIDRYTYYVINTVCQTAKSLNYKDRIKFYLKCRSSNLDKYLYKKNLFKLFIG